MLKNRVNSGCDSMVMHGCLLAGLVLSLGVAAAIAQDASQPAPDASAQPGAPDPAQAGGDMGGPGGFGGGGFGGGPGGFGGGPGGFGGGPGGFGGGPGGFGGGGFGGGGPGGMDAGGYDTGGQDSGDQSQGDGTYDSSGDTAGGNQPGMQNRRGGRGGPGGQGGRGGRGGNRNQPQDFQQGGRRGGGGGPGGGPGGRNVTGTGVALTDFSRISTNWQDFRSSIVAYNIFNPNRTGPNITTNQISESFSLVGIIDYKEGVKVGLAGTKAFFDGNKSEFVRGLKLNDVIASVYKITKIDPAAGVVTLTSGLGSLEMRVGTQMSRPPNGSWQGPFEGTGSYGGRGGGMFVSMDIGNGSTYGNPRGPSTTEGTLKLTSAEEEAVAKRMMQRRLSDD
jgi:hypothetical protein